MANNNRPTLAAAWLAPCFALLAAIVPATAAADPPDLDPQPAPRVFAVPTAWLVPNGGTIATAGLSHRGEPFTAVSAGLGGVAELDLTFARRDGLWQPSALFKLGGSVAKLPVALGFRRSLAVSEKNAVLYGALTLASRPVLLHVAIEAWQAQERTRAGLPEVPLTVRPALGLEWNPWIAPRSTVLLDFGWKPRFADGGASLAWHGNWGVRVRIVQSMSLELGVEMRQDEAIDRPSVFVRLNRRAAASPRRSVSAR
ncbi:MAG: hypothetical protein HY698_05495 [Deltaproteobacteria bacterium]|nr:hypothetical protein [Deltaproteobacteria bacterium]